MMKNRCPAHKSIFTSFAFQFDFLLPLCRFLYITVIVLPVLPRLALSSGDPWSLGELNLTALISTKLMSGSQSQEGMVSHILERPSQLSWHMQWDFGVLHYKGNIQIWQYFPVATKQQPPKTVGIYLTLYPWSGFPTPLEEYLNISILYKYTCHNTATSPIFLVIFSLICYTGDWSCFRLLPKDIVAISMLSARLEELLKKQNTLFKFLLTSSLCKWRQEKKMPLAATTITFAKYVTAGSTWTTNYISGLEKL